MECWPWRKKGWNVWIFHARESKTGQKEALHIIERVTLHLVLTASAASDSSKGRKLLLLLKKHQAPKPQNPKTPKPLFFKLSILRYIKN